METSRADLPSWTLDYLAHPDELDEEFDTFPTSMPTDIVRMRYDRMRAVVGRLQKCAGDFSTQGERLLSMLSGRDPRATALFVTVCLVAASFLLATPVHEASMSPTSYMFLHCSKLYTIIYSNPKFSLPNPVYSIQYEFRS